MPDRILFGWFVALLGLSAAAAGQPESLQVDHARFDAILKATVAAERIDYTAVANHHRDDLGAYLGSLESVDPQALERRERLAFYINLYNATVIDAVVRRQRPGYSPSEDEFKLFDEPLVRLDGKRVSLNHLEHEIVRREFDDPRIHAALVCAAVSCPPLLPRAYRAKDLDTVLEGNMRRFVNDPTRNRIDVASRRLELSSIFEWYAADFGGPEGLAGYVDRYTKADVRDFAVSHLPYSWELNAR